MPDLPEYVPPPEPDDGCGFTGSPELEIGGPEFSDGTAPFRPPQARRSCASDSTPLFGTRRPRGPPHPRLAGVGADAPSAPAAQVIGRRGRRPRTAAVNRCG